MSDSPMIPVYNPSTEKWIGEIVDSDAAAVDRAVARARESFNAGAWRRAPGAKRAQVLWNAAKIIERRLDELCAIESKDNGMAPAHARNMIFATTDMLYYNAGWCTKIHGQAVDIVVDTGITGVPAEFHAYTLMEPVGVVGVITPWNGPFFCAIMKLAPALAAGCSIVLKPAEETPLTALKLEEIFREAGLPEGVLNVVTGYGETAGAALTAHPDVDKIAFTGSTEVGKLIVQAAAGNLKKVTLELGGKSPLMMFGDADLSKAIYGAALGLYINSGQNCACTSRMYIHRSIFNEVVDGIARIAKGFRMGGDEDDRPDLGPVVSAKQRDRVMGIINDDVKAGATVVTGGKAMDRPGYFIEPTLLVDTNPSMRAIKEEIFGPVGSAIPFDDEDEVVALANDTHYGLASTVWTQDLTRAHRMAKRIEAGTVWVNTVLAADWSMPLGGYKQSGWGYERGWKGIETYLNCKSVHIGL